MVVAKEKCNICGKMSEFTMDDDAVLLREGRCEYCGASLRNSDVADEIIIYVNGNDKTGLKDQIEMLNGYKILNACTSGCIHETLKQCDNYICGEFLNGIKSGDYYNGVLCVNLCDIPFVDNTFDIVISEDVIEHIVGYQKAFEEIKRVLKPGGCHIFTVPIHEGGSKTLDRTGLVKVYHGDPLNEDGCIVVTDWGNDIVEILNGYGYQVQICRKHIFYKPEEITNVDRTYSEYLEKRNCLEKYFKYNSIVLRATKSEEEDMDNSNELFTGERFIPGIADTQLEIEHYQRYRSVERLIKDKVVLDAACGEGYGSRIVSEAAKKVIGIDISKETIERAAEKYSACKNLSFINASIEILPFEDKSIDAVISFETIEHVSEELQMKFLKEIKRVLKPDGFVVMSTPNKEIYTDLHHYTNEFHVKEFYGEEFIIFLKEEFRNVKLYNQYFEVVSLIDTVNGEDKNIFYFKDNEKYSQQGKYYIAIAGNDELPIESISSVFMNEHAEYQETVARIIELQGEEKIRNEHIFKLDEEISEKNNYILQLQSEHQDFSREINEKTEELKKQAEELEKQTEKLEKQTEELKKQKQEIAVKDTELGLKDSQIEKLGSELKQKKTIVYELNAKKEEYECSGLEVVRRGEHILKLDKEIEELREYREIAERELNSRAYKFGLKLRKAVAFFLPKGSKRRTMLIFVFKIFKYPKLMCRIFKFSRVKNVFKILREEGIKGIKIHYHKAEEAEKMLLYPCAENISEVNPIESKASLNEYSELNFIKYDKPLVSIIIPVYNQFDYTYKCLEAILQNSGDVPYEIIIADDNSTDFTQDIERKIHNIAKVTNSENKRFLRNCNHAAEYTRGEYILFLNNDTQVQPNWLKPMIDLLKKDETIGMTGAKLIYSNGQLQEAGGIVWKDASAWNYGNRKNPKDAEYNYVKEVDFISGAALMIRRSVWDEIGGFDEKFVPAYYEDVDLAFETRKRGYKVIYQPLSVVVHFEGVSNGTDIGIGQKSYQAVNQEKFYDKWKEVLEEENFSNGEQVFLAKDRARFKKHILVIDHYVPHFDKDAGGRGTFMYLKLFMEMGMHVTFLGDNFYNHEPYTTILNQMGIEILYGEFYFNNWEQWLKENGKYFDYVYLQRPHISMKYMDLVKEYTKAKIIYYDVDLCHIREMRQYEITKDASLLESAKKWKKVEFELIRKADVVHVVGSYEEQYLQKAFPNKPIRNIPLYIYQDINRNVDKNFARRQDILFVGGFGHPPNEDAVLWFAQEIFPKILKNYLQIKWYIVGSKPPISVQNLANENIVVKGFVSDEELQQLYNRCRMAVVPLRYGAGVKGKVLEAVYNQIPLVTTSVGAEGLSTEEDAFWIMDDADGMADLIIEVYEDYKSLITKSDNGIEFIQKHFMLKQAKEILLMDIDVN